MPILRKQATVIIIFNGKYLGVIMEKKRLETANAGKSRRLRIKYSMFPKSRKDLLKVFRLKTTARPYFTQNTFLY